MVLPVSKEQLAGCIDHTLLNPFAVRGDIEEHCSDAIRYGFYGVCVLGMWTGLVADIVHGTNVKVVGLVGFPFGADTMKVKVVQAKEAIMAGADEIDMVADLGAIISGDSRRLAVDIRGVLGECRKMRPGVGLKVIIESAGLGDEQIVFACKVCEQVGVDFIKTSTGLFGVGGATVEAVRLMADSAGKCRIKAEGGIESAEDAMAMLAAGASRIGSSASVKIVESFGGEVEG